MTVPRSEYLSKVWADGIFGEPPELLNGITASGGQW
jgi:hypothetical protein